MGIKSNQSADPSNNPVASLDRSPPVVHDIKCDPRWYSDLAMDRKTFEIRLNDRDYHAGDLLKIREYNATSATYTGRFHTAFIDKVWKDLPGLETNYVIMEINPYGF